ncbi:outer membrane autotransporter barrel domain protein [Camelimonas fluminis]|nr:outer membrane autotransporter barrel domain protein [Camelimonas fluminis]
MTMQIGAPVRSHQQTLSKHGATLLLSTAIIALASSGAFAQSPPQLIPPISLNGINGGLYDGFAISTGPGTHAVNVFNPGADLTLSNGQIATNSLASTSQRSYGLLAHTGGSIFANGIAVNTTGDRGHAVQAGSRGTGSATSIYDGSTAGAITVRSGTISTDGQYAVGLHAVDAGRINLDSSTVNTAGLQSPGAHAESNSTINVANSSITTGEAQSAGVLANNDRKSIDPTATGGVVDLTNTTVTTRGYGSHGVEATDGATVHVAGGAIFTEAMDSIGLLAHAGATVFSNTNVTTAMDGAHAVQAGLNSANQEALAYNSDTAAHIALTGGILTTSGQNASAITATDGGSVAAANVAAHTSGLLAHGVHARSNSSIIIDTSDVSTTGSSAAGLRASNERLPYQDAVEGGVIDARSVSVTTSGTSAHGIEATDGARVGFASGSIRTSGVNAHGVNANNATIGIDTDIETTGASAAGIYAHKSLIDVTGSVTTNGSFASGLVAIDSRVVSNADIQTNGMISSGVSAAGTTTVALNAGSVTTTGNSSFGVMASETAVINASVPIHTSGENAHGAFITTAGQLNLNGGSITATGASAAGAYIEGAALVANHASITSAQDAAVRMTDNATVVLNNTRVAGQTATIAAGFTSPNKTAHITVGAGSVLTSADNILLYVDRSNAAGGATGVVNMNLQNGSVSHGDIIDDGARTTGYTDVDIGETAIWKGQAYGVRNLRSAAPGSDITLSQGTEILGDIETNRTKLRFDSAGGTVGGSINLANGTVSSGGSIATPIVVGGNLNVDETSVMGGNWDIAGALNARGTITPGNSIGVVNVAGNLNLAPTATYNVEINAAGESDRINVAGVAYLAGQVAVSTYPAVNDYRVDTPYTIVTAGGGFAGTRFDGASWVDTTSYIFLDPQLSYDPNNVYLTIKRTDVKMEDVAQTPNQAATGSAIDQQMGLSPLFMKVATLTDVNDVRNAFNALSGEAHASVTGALVEESRHVREAVNTRLRQAAGSATAGLSNNTRTIQGLTFWGQGFGGWGNSKGQGYSISSASRSTAGFFIGVDTPVFDTWRIGAAAGYSRSSIDVKSRQSAATVDSYHVALYGGANFGNLGLRLGASYTWNDIDLNRSITFPGFTDATSASYNAAVAQVFGEMSYTITSGATTIEPYLGLAWVNVHTDRFTERGGYAGLTGKSADMNTFFTTVGARFSHTYKLDNGNELIARAGVGYRHAFGDVDPRSVMLFQSSNTPFSVAGAPIARSSVILEAGLDMKIAPNLAIGVSYQGQLGQKVQDHAIKANVTVNF